MILFEHIFRLAGDAAPDLAKLFKFGREPDFDLTKLSENAGLRKHGEGVVKTVGVAVSMLTKLDELVPVLKGLGKRHKNYGVVDAHYPVVGGALLATLEQGLGEGYTPEIADAFGAMWGVVADTMKAGAAEIKLLKELGDMDFDGDGLLTFDEMCGYFAQVGTALNDEEFDLIVEEMRTAATAYALAMTLQE